MKIGIIGDNEDISGFTAIGAEPYTEGENYAIIFIMENKYEESKELIERFKNSSVPATVILPTAKADNGLGLESVRRSVIRAVGADIL